MDAATIPAPFLIMVSSTRPTCGDRLEPVPLMDHHHRLPGHPFLPFFCLSAVLGLFPHFLGAEVLGSSRGDGGVKVQKMAGDLPRAERETTLAFNDAETKAEVTTCRHDWMRQLERYGAVPETIQVFEHGDGEHRWCIVPKSWITKPYPEEARARSIIQNGTCEG